VTAGSSASRTRFVGIGGQGGTIGQEKAHTKMANNTPGERPVKLLQLPGRAPPPFGGRASRRSSYQGRHPKLIAPSLSKLDSCLKDSRSQSIPPPGSTPASPPPGRRWPLAHHHGATRAWAEAGDGSSLDAQGQGAKESGVVSRLAFPITSGRLRHRAACIQYKAGRAAHRPEPAAKRLAIQAREVGAQPAGATNKPRSDRQLACRKNPEKSTRDPGARAGLQGPSRPRPDRLEPALDLLGQALALGVVGVATHRQAATAGLKTVADPRANPLPVGQHAKWRRGWHCRRAAPHSSA